MKTLLFHYGTDILCHSVSLGISKWKNGYIEFPISLYCLQLDNIERVPIANDSIKIEVYITDKETKNFFVNFISDTYILENNLCVLDKNGRYFEKFIKYIMLPNGD